MHIIIIIVVYIYILKYTILNQKHLSSQQHLSPNDVYTSTSFNPSPPETQQLHKMTTAINKQ